jgi:hypothetical protein
MAVFLALVAALSSVTLSSPLELAEILDVNMTGHVVPEAQLGGPIALVRGL